MILPASKIRELGLVVGGVDAKIDDGETPSYGMDGCGYTFRCDSQFSIEYIGPLNSILLRSFERVKMPNNIVGRTAIKSTHGRAGIFMVDCIIDPGYEGFLHARLFNTSGVTYELDTTGGVFMVVFEEMEPTTPYKGRHMGPIVGVNSGVISYAYNEAKQ